MPGDFRLPGPHVEEGRIIGHPGKWRGRQNCPHAKCRKRIESWGKTDVEAASEGRFLLQQHLDEAHEGLLPSESPRTC